MIDIQGNLAAILKEKGISRKQVAIEMGVTSPAVSNWFNRTGDIKFSTLSQICEKMGVDIIDVLTYPRKYIPEDSLKPECEECKRKDEMIENLTELLRMYKTKLKEKKKE